MSYLEVAVANRWGDPSGTLSPGHMRGMVRLEHAMHGSTCHPGLGLVGPPVRFGMAMSCLIQHTVDEIFLSKKKES